MRRRRSRACEQPRGCREKSPERTACDGNGKTCHGGELPKLLFKAGIKQHSQTVNGKTIQGTKKSGHASGYRVVDDQTVQVSTHSADAEYFLQNGTNNNMSFVIRRPSVVKDFTPHPKADLLEIVYNRAPLKNNSEDMARIVHDIAWFVGTGEFCDTVGAAKYNYSGSKDFIREKMLGLIEDADKRGDEKSRKLIEKDAKRKEIDLKTKLPPHKPLAEVVGAAQYRGGLPTDDAESLTQGELAVNGEKRLAGRGRTRRSRAVQEHRRLAGRDDGGDHRRARPMTAKFFETTTSGSTTSGSTARSGSAGPDAENKNRGCRAVHRAALERAATYQRW